MDDINKKWAASLTAEDTGLIPYLPYLLQDLWELGTQADLIQNIVRKHVADLKGKRFLDLGCGKGAVSIRLAEVFGVRIKGVDLMEDFIKEARKISSERGLDDLCSFEVGDINQAVQKERDYDCVILGAVGDVLGPPPQTLQKMACTVKDGGYLIIDDAYTPEQGAQVKYNNYEYLTWEHWQAAFAQAGLSLLEADKPEGGQDLERNRSELALITARAAELSVRYPEKKPMFDGYIQSQANEYDDLENALEGVIWFLQKNVGGFCA